MYAAEEEFYDALEDPEPQDEGPESAAQTAARLSSSVQERMQVTLSEDQIAAVRALLEQQMLADEGGSGGGSDEDSASEEEDSEDHGVRLEEQAGDGQGDGDGYRETAAGEYQWRWTGRGQQGVPLDQYEHPSQIPKFTSKADWYNANSERLLYNEAGLTILESVFYLMAWKADYAVTDAAFGSMLGMLSQLFLPKVRSAASSFLQLKTAMQRLLPQIVCFATSVHIAVSVKLVLIPPTLVLIAILGQLGCMAMHLLKHSKSEKLFPSAAISETYYGCGKHYIQVMYV
jgi:hypothetical protein